MIRIAVLTVLVLAACSHKRQPDAPPLPVLGQLPEFALTSQQGTPFGSAELRGQVWVADFVFTRCPSICPLLTSHLRAVQERTSLPRLVSFSVDPEHDTPAVLAAYAAKHGVDQARWTFLTGSYPAVHAIVEKGLLQHMEQVGQNADLADVNHSPYFVIIDRELRIRAFHDMNEPGAIDRVVRDLDRLLKEQTKAPAGAAGKPSSVTDSRPR